MSETRSDVFKRGEAEHLTQHLDFLGEVDWPGWEEWEDTDLYESLEEIGFEWDGFLWTKSSEWD